MKRISDNFYSSIELINHLDRNVFASYSDKDNCLHNMCWHIYGLLETGRKVNLFVESIEDLNNINYFLSKYGLSELTSINIDNQALNNSILSLQKSKYNPTEITALELDFTRQLKEIKAAIQEFLSSCHADMNIIELNDRKLVDNLIPKISLSSEFLFNSIDKTESESKKKMLDYSQNLYDSSFRHLDKFNPFHSDIIHNDISGVHSYLTDVVSDIEKLLFRYEKIEKEIEQYENKELINRISRLREMHNDIERLYKPTESEYSPTVRKKILFLLQNLKNEIGDNSPTDINLNIAINKTLNFFDEYKVKLNDKSTDKLSNIYKAMTIHSTEYDLKELFNDVDTLQDNINYAGIFSQLYNRKAVSFYNLKRIVLDIKRDIDYALFFITYNDSYLRWNNYYETLSSIDKSIIDHHISENSSWKDSFERQLSQMRMRQSLLRISSVNKALNGLCNKFYDLAYRKLSLVYSTDEKGDFDTEFGRKAIVIYCNSVDNNSDDTDDNSTVFIGLNLIPNKNLNSSRIKIFTYNEKIALSSHSKLKTLLDLELINDSSTYYSVTKSLQQLKSHERNIASLYLGQSLRRICPRYSIYKMKCLSIVSFLTKLKNIQIRQSLFSEGIKEVFSDKDDYNLLPGIFSDSDAQPVILIEDGLLDKAHLESIISQLMLIDQINSMGVRLLVVDNYSLIKNEATLDEVINTLIKLNKDNSKTNN